MKPYYAKLPAESLQGYAQLIKSKVYTPVSALQVEAWATDEPVSFAARRSGKKLTLDKGDVWGGLFDCAWFHFTGKAPAGYIGKDVVVLIDVSGEGLVVDGAGEPVIGITRVDPNYDRVMGTPAKRVYRPAIGKDGGIDFWMDAGNNDLFGNYRGGKLLECDIAVFDAAAHRLMYDFGVLHDLLAALPENSARYYSVLYALIGAGELISDWNAENVGKASALLAAELEKKGGTPSLEFFATGHAHLDLAWLWPLRETKRKAARTFATALANIDSYPGYIFGQSQPQQYQWLKDGYPGLYGRIKEKVNRGRIEPQGAMWVEADTNISGGEALIRQILYGKKFFKDEFGADVDILHLPDVFGFSAALPQILKKCGVDKMLTIKLTWNKQNAFPHHTFNWAGLDGSVALVHMPPESTYNGEASPASVKRAEENFPEKGVCKHALILYGIGDGGGGPGETHLESLKRIGDLDGIAPVRNGTSAEFFKKIAPDRHKFKTVKGELYLENHLGCYTTQARNKYYNRLLEKLLRDCEMLYAITGEKLPKDEIDAIWKEILLYQFHDILPGSSIKRVYDESVARYRETETRVRGLIAEAAGGKKTWFNSLSWERGDYIADGGKWFKVKAPALGTGVAEEVKDFGVTAAGGVLSNGLVTAVFNEKGGVSSLTVGGFEAIKGEANILNIYCDNGNAWDIDSDYYLKPVHRARPAGAKEYVSGPYAVREQEFTYGNSKFKQIIKLREGCPYLEFENIVDWHEERKMFRVDGNFNVVTDGAVCDIQFGNIKRSALENNSLDSAQFEICAHKYIDLSDGVCGAALLNDCKYGYRAKGDLISMNALRSTDYPGKDADRGAQAFRYAIYPHTGGSDVERLSYEFNFPLIPCGREIKSYIGIDRREIMVETVKPAESGAGVILRLYNNKGYSVSADIKLPSGVKAAYLTDMLENDISGLEIKGGKIRLEFKGFEIHTVRLGGGK